MPPVRAVDDAYLAADIPESAELQVLARPVTTPPALPWDQLRAARLEATLNAPLPLSEVAFQLIRLEPWRPGSPGRYAAVYARHDDVRQGFSTTVQVGDRHIAVQFLSPDRRRAQVRRLATVGGIAAVGGFLLVMTVASVVVTRVQATERLEVLEQGVQRKLGESRRAAKAAAQLTALAEAGVSERRAEQVLADLRWVAEHKDPAVDIEAIHWEGGLLAIEVRGEANPFLNADRPVQRAAKPVRPGVWLWGVTGAPSADGVQL